MRHVWPAIFGLLFVLLSGCFSAAELPGGGNPIESFTAERPKVTRGATDKLVAVYGSGNGSIDNGIGDVQSGAEIETPALTADTTFTLTVTLDSGETFTKSLEVKAVDAPSIQSFKQDKVVRPGEESSVTAVFVGGKGDLEGFGEIVSGTPKSIGKLDATKNLNLKVTSEAGEVVTATTEVEAAVTPVIQSFTAPGPVVSRYAPTQLSAMFTGGKGTIDQEVGPVVSGTPATTKPVPAAGATFKLTVTNGLNESVSKTLSVTTKPEVIVTTYNGDVVAFDVDAQGNVPPKRVLTTGADGLVGLAVINNEIFVAAENGAPSISVFDIDAKGKPAPKRKISGAATGWGGDIGAYMFGVAGTEMFVADKSNAIKVWNLSDNGNVAPKRKIAGAATGLNNVLGVAVGGGEIYATNYAMGGGGSITAYAQAAANNAAPLRTIPGLPAPSGIIVNGAELYVGGLDGTIKVYNRTTKALLRTLSGAATTLGTLLYQCAVADTELFCASYDNERILVFPTTANGNVAPKRAIGGDMSALGGAVSVVVY